MNPNPAMPEISIDKKAPETPVFDVMGGCARWEVKVHEHGLVALLDVMPRFAPVGKTADFAIVQAARVSYGEGTKQVNEDRGLIRYLARHRHTTPFEMVEFKFHHVMPIFVARQWIRHRTANVNEYSARYSVVKDRFYRPTLESLRKQSTTNRQGGTEPIDAMTAEEFNRYLDAVEAHYADYERMLDKGVAPRAGPDRPAAECLHGVVLEDRPAQPLALPVVADGRPRPAGNPRLRECNVCAHPAHRPHRDRSVHGLQLPLHPPLQARGRGIRTGQALPTDNKREQAEWDEKKKRLGIE